MSVEGGSIEKMVTESIVRRLRKQIAFGGVNGESAEEVFDTIFKLVKMSYPEDFVHAFMSVLLVVASDDGMRCPLGAECIRGLVDMAIDRGDVLRSTKSTPSRLLCCIQG